MRFGSTRNKKQKQQEKSVSGLLHPSDFINQRIWFQTDQEPADDQLWTAVQAYMSTHGSLKPFLESGVSLCSLQHHFLEKGKEKTKQKKKHIFYVTEFQTETKRLSKCFSEKFPQT